MTPKYSKEVSKRLNTLRASRCYWMCQAMNPDLTDERRDYIEAKVNSICQQIAEITGCRFVEVYRDLNIGHRGRPRSTYH